MLLVLLGLVALPAFCWAHGPVDPAASDYLAQIRTVPVGVQARVVDGDLRLWLRVAGSREVTVLDYQGDPYVRFDERGVAVNENSAMFYLNLRPVEPPPAHLSVHARPRWHFVNRGDAYEWHDGRLHALATTLSAPGVRDLGRWRVPLRIDGRAAALEGVLERAPRPPVSWWWPLAVALACLPAILRLRDGRADRALGRVLEVLALTGFVLAAVAAGLHGRPGLAGSLLAILALELGFAGWAVWRIVRRDDGFVVQMLVASAAVLRATAAITVLWRGYVLQALPAPVERGAVSVGLAAGVSLFTLLAVRAAQLPAGRGAAPSAPPEPAA